LEQAARKGELSLVKRHVEAQLEGVQSLYLTLMTAISHGYLEIVKYLINNSANIYTLEKYLFDKGIVIHITDDALRAAVENGHIELAKFLITKGANINEQTVEQAVAKGNFDMTKLLIEKGISSKILTRILGIAVDKNKLDMVKCLVESGADIYSVQKELLFLAIDSDYLNIVKYLIGLGVKPNLLKQAIQLAAYHNNKDIITYLSNLKR
jgi:ankyrin repeat protein